MTSPVTERMVPPKVADTAVAKPATKQPALRAGHSSILWDRPDKHPRYHNVPLGSPTTWKLAQ